MSSMGSTRRQALPNHITSKVGFLFNQSGESFVKHGLNPEAGLTQSHYLKVKIFVDNQTCVGLLNYGVSRSPFLAACLREISYFLAKFNIELRAEYVPSKENHLADLCSRAFSNDTYYNNFNRLLVDGVLILESVDYNKFNFEFDL